MAALKYCKHSVIKNYVVMGITRTILETGVRKKSLSSLPCQAFRFPLQEELNWKVDDHLMEKS